MWKKKLDFKKGATSCRMVTKVKPDINSAEVKFGLRDPDLL